MSDDGFPMNTWLTRHPKCAMALLVAVIFLWTGLDGLLAGSN